MKITPVLIGAALLFAQGIDAKCSKSKSHCEAICSKSKYSCEVFDNMTEEAFLVPPKTIYEDRFDIPSGYKVRGCWCSCNGILNPHETFVGDDLVTFSCRETRYQLKEHVNGGGSFISTNTVTTVTD